MIETNILARGGRALESRLPPGWTQKLTALRGTPREADATLRIVSPDGVEALLAVEVKARLFPRDVPGLKRQLEPIEGGAGLVMTEFLTPSAKRRLVEENLNYLDLTGNIRLQLSRPGLFIATDGATTDLGAPLRK